MTLRPPSWLLKPDADVRHSCEAVFARPASQAVPLVCACVLCASCVFVLHALLTPLPPPRSTLPGIVRSRAPLLVSPCWLRPIHVFAPFNAAARATLPPMSGLPPLHLQTSHAITAALL